MLERRYNGCAENMLDDTREIHILLQNSGGTEGSRRIPRQRSEKRLWEVPYSEDWKYCGAFLWVSDTQTCLVLGQVHTRQSHGILPHFMWQRRSQWIIIPDYLPRFDYADQVIGWRDPCCLLYARWLDLIRRPSVSHALEILGPEPLQFCRW